MLLRDPAFQWVVGTVSVAVDVRPSERVVSSVITEFILALRFFVKDFKNTYLLASSK